MSKPYDGGPIAVGPFTYDEAYQELKDACKKHGGQVNKTSGYWGNLPSYANDEKSEDVWCVVKLGGVADFRKEVAAYDDEY